MAQVMKKHDSNIRKMMPDGSNVLFSEDESDEEDTRNEEDEEESVSINDGNEEQETSVDRYGFYLDAGKTTLALSDQEVSKRRLKEKTREVKWEKMRSNWRNFSTKDGGKKKLKSRIRKGIPDKLRGEIWDVLCRVKQLKQAHREGRYEQLCIQAEKLANDASVETPLFDTIERDLGRTFPRHTMFHPSGSEQDARSSTGLEPLGIARLRRLLRAYSIYDPEVGYCQGMSFFCAMFLIYRPSPLTADGTMRNVHQVDEGEERAFWQLVSVMHRPFNGIRSLYFSGMAEIQLCLHTFEQLTLLHLPAVARHIESEGLVFSMFATSWYMTVFSSAFPFDLVVRVWDAFLAEGFKIIHRVCLSLLKCFTEVILSLGFEELINFLQHELPTQVDPDLIMTVAFRIPLKKIQIEAIAESYKAAQKENGRGTA